jgi:broad specificity phosphatase PhoE
MVESHPHADTIIVIRHGQQERNGETYDDSVGGPLSSIGRDQVRRSRELLLPVLQELGGLTVSGCISSDLPRAVETARILTEDLLPPDQILQHPGLRERRLGDLDHREQHADPAFSEFRQDALYAAPKGSESLASLLWGRLREPIAKAHQLAAAPNQAVVISAHGGVNHALLREFTGMTNRQLSLGPLVQGATIKPFLNPGSIKNGQMHIYTSQTGMPYYNVRTLGIIDDQVFDSGVIAVERALLTPDEIYPRFEEGLAKIKPHLFNLANRLVEAYDQKQWNLLIGDDTSARPVVRFARRVLRHAGITMPVHYITASKTAQRVKPHGVFDEYARHIVQHIEAPRGLIITESISDQATSLSFTHDVLAPYFQTLDMAILGARREPLSQLEARGAVYYGALQNKPLQVAIWEAFENPIGEVREEDGWSGPLTNLLPNFNHLAYARGFNNPLYTSLASTVYNRMNELADEWAAQRRPTGTIGA